MRMETRLQARLSQEMRLAPQMIQSMEILQLPALELQERIQQELEENPALEANLEKAGEPETGKVETKPLEEEISDEDSSWYERMASTRGKRAAPGEEDRKLEMLQNTVDRPQSLQDHLHEQIRFMEVPPEYAPTVDQIIYNLNDNGYLPLTLEQLVEASDPKVDLAVAEKALRIVQSLEPAGVAARDLKECLLLQLAGDGSPEAALARDLVTGHLEDLEAHRYPRISKATGHSIDDIQRAVALIATLNPKPGSLYGGTASPRVVPDVVVEEIDGRYEVRIESHYIPELTIGEWYRKRIEESKNDPKLREWIKRKIESARWLIEAIVQRQDTLQRTANAIVDAQKGFLDHGIEHLAPLKMQQIADKVGVHVSTVSRAISKKYIQTPRGIYPMKFFFTGGVQSAEGEMESWVVVRQKVAEVVAAEDKKKPLSDGEIADRLKKQGLDVARRTVTKYRKMLKLGSSRMRKEY